MGMLDGINVLSGMYGTSSGAQQNPLVQAALQLLQQNGGLEGVLGKFKQAGYGQQTDSWVSTGQNLPISGDVLSQVLGDGQLGQIAQQLGLSRGDTAGGLASLLPQLVDRMTPHGEIPAGDSDIVSQALALLQRGESRTD